MVHMAAHNNWVCGHVIRMLGIFTNSNHATSSKWAYICHTTMCRNLINVIYNPGHVTLWCMEVGPVANAREGSTQEHDQARVVLSYYQLQYTILLSHIYRVILPICTCKLQPMIAWQIAFSSTRCRNKLN